MNLVRDLSTLPRDWRGGAVSIGNFDGVHRGHARIVERLVASARRLGGRAIVFTFEPHPIALLRPAAAPPPLTWTERKAALLSSLGVDGVVCYPTDLALLRLEPEAFFTQIVREQLAAAALVEGPNFCFGRDRRGTIDVLARLCAAAQLPLEVVEPVRDGEEFISSTRVRRLLAAGDVTGANALLTAPQRTRGLVGRGAQRGATLGFPTANLERIDTLIPAPGVYAAWVHLGERAILAAVNVGPCPTFGEGSHKLEAHLLDYAGDLYGQMLEIEWLARLRDVRTFSGREELVAQLQRDVAAVRTWGQR